MKRTIWLVFLTCSLITSLLNDAIICAREKLVWPFSGKDRSFDRVGLEDQHYFSISDSQKDEFDKLLAAHRSHRSHSSHRSHYSGRGLGSAPRHSSHYSSRATIPSYSTPSSLFSILSKTGTTRTSPRKFHSWETKEYKVNSVDNPCTSSGNFEWCLDQSRIKSSPQTSPQALASHATLKVIFPKGPVDITQNSSLSYSVDNGRNVACKITRVVPLYYSTEVYFEPPNVGKFNQECKKGRHLRFIIQSGGVSQEASFSLSGFTKAQNALLDEVKTALEAIRH